MPILIQLIESSNNIDTESPRIKTFREELKKN
jgi:hypothetical protein